nr:reverse transcriptase domain-containing protein [Tanacetum cinerariifolium]
MTSVLALPPVSGALSPVHADLIPSPKRVRDSSYLADVELGHREISLRDDVISRGSDEPHLEQDIDPKIQEKIIKCFAYADALRDRWIDARVVVEAVDRHEIDTGVRGPIEVRVERITHPAMPEDISEPGQDGAVEVTYETLGDLVQRFHDHTKDIPVHRVGVIDRVQREQGHRIIRVESAVTVLTERVVELERDNMRLRGTASVESQRVDRLQRDMKMSNTRFGASMTHEEIEELVSRQVAKEMKAREAARNLETLNDNGDKQEGENEGNGNGGNEGNGNGGNGENGNHSMNYGGFMPMARECTFQDFLKCKPHTFSGTEGIVGLTRWNEIQNMETELCNLTVKRNDLIAYTQRFQELILLCTRIFLDEEDRVERSAENKRRMESNPRDHRGQQPPFKRQNTSGQNITSEGCTMKGYDYPKLRSQNRGNQTRNKSGNKTGNKTRCNEVTAKAYAIVGEGTNPDSNVVTGTFLLNNCYASMLFDSGVDRSFMSTTFSALLDVAPSTLDTSYVVKLADGRISETNIILRGCTLGLLGHPFNIDLMPVELGSSTSSSVWIGW